VTGYELRRHLIQMHNIVMWGAAYDHLARRHDQDHATAAGHTHDHDGEGDG